MKVIDTIGKKVGLGFTLITAVLAISVLITINLVHDVNLVSEHITDVSEPSSIISLELKSALNETIADLRATVLLDSEEFNENRQEIWTTQIRPYLQDLDRLSRNWNNDQSQVLFDKITPMIYQLEDLQTQAEELNDIDKAATIEFLDVEILPLTGELIANVNELSELHQNVLNKDFAVINTEISQLRNVLWILLFAGLMISIVLTYTIINTITPSLNKAVNVALEIGDGNLESEVFIGGSLEIRELGTALINMRDALKKREQESKNYDWLTSGKNKFSDVIRGDHEVEGLADQIIRFIVEHTKTSIGSVYLVDDSGDKLVLAGKYAFNSEDEIQTTFKKGEGLIGQAAVNREPIFLHGMDEQYIKVKSSIIESVPNHILAIPFLVDDEVLGVIEIGKFEVFDELQITFIESIQENIGIAFRSAISRRKIQQLLEETQVQSEELQQQHEELEQNNEELEEQTQKLTEQHEELQAANEEMEEQTQIVEQKNQDLESARTQIELKAKQLEISSKYKSEFLANMSHELRTPLNSLLILANDLLKNKKGNLDDDQIESADVIANSGRDLLNLINEILDLSKIESGKMDLNVSSVAIEDIATDLNRKLKSQAEQKGVQFAIHIDETLPTKINTDRQRLDQIIKNLVSNAIKFTDNGQIDVNFKYNDGDFMSIEVKDSGIGIPANKLDIIFEAFQQAEGGTARKYGGTGLGLSISRELAKLLNGNIKVESKEGEGSIFTLIFPMNSEAKVKEIPLPALKKEVVINEDRYFNYSSIEDDRNTITDNHNVILIIEDDKDFARILGKQAHKKDFKYLAASTGEDGLQLANKYRPTAIILDMQLPGIDGHMVLKELKGSTEIRHIPVHIISSEEKSLDPIKSGAVQYLTKPVTKDQLDGAFVRIEDFINRKMKSLLIVEDNDNLRTSIVKLIGNGDVDCVEASTGEEAITQMKNNTIDCIVLDIGLPDMNGFELIKKLDSNSEILTPPIIVYTGKELSRAETEQLQEYAETIIVKGIKSEERLLDETALFLHRTVTKLPQVQQDIITGLYDKEKLFYKKKVLLVDDDMRNVFALSKVLRDRGMEVLKADNGIVALEVLSDHSDTHVVLMDIMMPKMDGYECMQHIRKNKKLKDLPIIALTAKAMMNDRQKCLDAGADDYITKPVDIERLLSLMRIWIRKE